ncbi:MAG TPA: YdbL family protein [Sphingomicrobium sp.]|jgi:hypothetical protein|nr:YdbL family protein [Sphingomicrobium sp.]
MKPIALLAFAVGLSAFPAFAQPPAVAQAIGMGQVGERYDGYMGILGTVSPQVRREVSAINIRRRNLYLQLSARRNVTADLVGMATGCQLLSKLAAGEPYMLNDGVWRRRPAGESVPLPDYCR